MTASDKKITIVFFVLFIISSLFFFDVVRIDMEDETKSYPVFVSGEPADMPVIEERFGVVEAALCSTTKKGEKIVRLAAISVLQHAVDDLGGNGIIELVTSYGKHNDLHKDCPYGVAVQGTAVLFTD
ncbi:MAG: hypothetical protein AB1Y26_01345 [Cycloclasticus sp.]|nr:hypothetical protein A9Q85_01865 [Cycloclasticus sp. 44_32_T64]